VSISSSAGKVSRTEENGVISLNEHADSLDKLTKVKRVARVFRDLTPQLRDKRNRSLVHGPMCLDCHWLKLVGCRQFSMFQRLSFIKSKLLILSEYVNKTEKIGETLTNTNIYRESEALSDIFT